MKFIQKQDRWRSPRWEGKKNGFLFKYGQNNDKWYVFVSHTKKDIRFNSLWEKIQFNTKEEAEEWCNNFKPENFPCLGKDFNVPLH